MEQNGCDKYIRCSVCKCKYINDDSHIKDDFGYNRLGERYKTCVKCRGKNHKYREKQLAQPVDADHKCCSKCLRIKPTTDYGEYAGVVEIDGKCCNQQLTYTRCIDCRNKDKSRVYYD